MYTRAKTTLSVIYQIWTITLSCSGEVGVVNLWAWLARKKMGGEVSNGRSPVFDRHVVVMALARIKIKVDTRWRNKPAELSISLVVLHNCALTITEKALRIQWKMGVSLPTTKSRPSRSCYVMNYYIASTHAIHLHITCSPLTHSHTCIPSLQL